ncbi:MAG: N-acetylneuraminate synthase family protein [Candidatus Planktophila sp.]|nr:N-acetylneuraminate synthase family protein [Candidatus Planktophila sp.]
MQTLRRILAKEEIRPYVIAEISANHGGALENAKSLIMAAKNAGADAVKLQTFTADTITVNSNETNFLIPDSSNLWGGRNLWSLMKEAETPLVWHEELFGYANSLGLEVFSTAYDIDAAIFLEQSGIKAIKVSSFDLINIPLLDYLAKRDVLVIISTGMSKTTEINKASEIFTHKKSTTAFLQCTSSYPCSVQDVNINRHDLLKSFGFVTGYSDHTLDPTAAILAIGKGALIFEKHITLMDINTLDSEFSMNEFQFKNYVETIWNAFNALGDFDFSPTPSETASLWERPSIIALTDIAIGETLSRINIGIRRPSLGADPIFFNELINSPSEFSLRKGEGFPTPKIS